MVCLIIIIVFFEIFRIGFYFLLIEMKIRVEELYFEEKFKEINFRGNLDSGSKILKIVIFIVVDRFFKFRLLLFVVVIGYLFIFNLVISIEYKFKFCFFK